jgi:hypothetical protein
VHTGFGQSLGCTGPLRELNLNSVKSIADWAFDSFVNLEIVHLDACEELGSGAFDYYTKIHHVSLPSIKKMSSGVFGNSHYLEWVDLGENLTSMGGMIFADCPALNKVIIRAN